ncbi:PLDc N-terminal domain-containing protein [Arthrobacter sp. Sa2CUA1]|uniref:PLDc N-terminal domain-containing protein n=1 Tax=Arthrobacter gallicola TaxID=2762225 RepID=A0ABR8USK5_9MICC|nr:PLDc N-terminal domain-containing protein [Arthrobacter gallicola]MBD7995086.1 PLDc N-terminal domain-containing protein [Arthrobacter gallicola]
MEGTNPVLPTGHEALMIFLGVAYALLAVAAVVSLSRQKHLEPAVKLLCLLGILGFPLAGSLTWFLYLWRQRRAVSRQARSAPASSR